MARVRAKSHERFSDPVVMKEVISLLEQDEPITKKAACEMLNISYNTARLAKIIEEFKDKVALDKRLRKELRNKPISKSEKRDIVSSYLSGDALSFISEYTHRSITVIKNVLNSYGVPLRDSSVSYFNPVYLENSDFNNYTKGDLVYSARYNCPAYIREKISDEVYTLWTTGDRAKSITQPYYELADLRSLQSDLGIEIEGISKEEYNLLLMEALKKANKRGSK